MSSMTSAAVLLLLSASGAATAGTPSSPAPDPPVPAYVKAGAFAEREVTVGAAEWALPGTLAMPTGPGPVPAVVLVHGSGPHDRDESVGGAKPFRDLAQGLASRGIAVLRYEKRTRAHGARMANGVPTLEAEVIDDAAAAARLLLATPGIDATRVFVVGHSLGGTLAPRVAKAEPKVAGIVSLAGATRPPWTLVLEQIAHLESVGAADAATAARLRADMETIGRVARGEAPDPKTPVMGVPTSYWLAWGAVRPAEEAAALGKPVLALRGARDYQVGPADQALWEKALAGKPNCAARTLPGLNHLFVEGEGVSTPAEYAKRGHVAAAVLDAIAAFVGAARP